MTGLDMMRIALLLARRLPSERALPKVENLCKFYIQLLQLGSNGTLSMETVSGPDISSVSMPRDEP
jgi:hypothetical protein